MLAFIIDRLSPKEDHTFYRQTSGSSDFKEDKKSPPVTEAMQNLFKSGKQQVEAEKKKESEQKRKVVSIKYAAPQIVGESDQASVMRLGSKLIGVLKNPIDTRTPSLVRVSLPRGGESSNIEIAPGSVLVGQFGYSGDGNKVTIKFSRLDLAGDGGLKKISASALDAGDFTPGIQGEEFTGGGVKLAASLGLTVFSGMADTLTDRESLGNTFNGVQAKPSMKDAILQGLSKASQDQANRTASTIEQERGYVIVPEGKEMIVELLEDYK